jgi:hypothetical protein
MNTVAIERKTLHQLIDDLPEKQLEELMTFAKRLLAKTAPPNTPIATETTVPYETENSVDAIIRQIKSTAPDLQTITLPTKTWADYLAEAANAQPSYKVENVAVWNRTWDAFEAKIEAQSVIHERNEYEEDWM